MLRYGVRCRYVYENPAALIPNPAPKHSEMKIFSWPEIEAVSAELPPHYRAIHSSGLRPVPAANTGIAL